jgi:hypothetical protein
MRYPAPLLLMLVSTLVFARQRSPLPEVAKQTEGNGVCKLESLPQEIRNRITMEFASWKVQEPETLSPRAHERWESEKPQHCPGIAIGQFENEKTVSYGVLLTHEGRADSNYKFLVFSPKGGTPSFEIHVLEQSDDGGGSNLFIRGVGIGKFFSESSKKKFRVQAPEGILLVDSGENEYEADIYFWVSDAYQHQPLDY